MLIRSYLAVVILSCLAGTYIVEFFLSQRHINSQKKTRIHVEYQLALKDVERIRKDIAQYLISVDLIIGADETYLLNGTLDKGKAIIEDLNQLEVTILNKLLNGQIEDLIQQFTSINKLLDTTSTLGSSIREASLFKILTKTDQISQDLISNLDTIFSQVDQTEKTLAKQLKEDIQQTDTLTGYSRILYAIFVLIIWTWGNRHICRPIRDIFNAAKQLGQVDKVNLVTRGPKELVELSTLLQGVASELIFQARHDPLTKLLNRREFSRKLSDFFSHTIDKTGKQLLCFVDLDRFKSVNDSCGHAAGDDLLIQVAHIIENTAGKNSIVSRLGGDEFAILLNGQNQNEAMNTARRILNKIRAIRFYWGSNVYRISASIGVTYIEDFDVDISEWLNAADAACLAAKAKGRDKIQLFKAEDARLNEKRCETKLYNDIIDALENDRFILYHQDIVSLCDKSTDQYYYEILLRMTSAEGTLIQPGHFLEIAERYHLAERIDRWVINKTIDWLIENPIHLKNLNTCSINLSGQSLANEELRQFIIEKITNNNFPANKLCFEITETAAIEDMSEANHLFEEVGKLGCKFALDDFGAGLSSFAYLKKLPVNAVKIDGEFVKDIELNHFNEVMVKSINDIAQIAGMYTIAEYVENQKIANKLQTMGVNFAQGYHYSRPIPLDDKVDDNKLRANG